MYSYSDVYANIEVKLQVNSPSTDFIWGGGQRKWEDLDSKKFAALDEMKHLFGAPVQLLLSQNLEASFPLLLGQQPWAGVDAGGGQGPLFSHFRLPTLAF